MPAIVDVALGLGSGTVVAMDLRRLRNEVRRGFEDRSKDEQVGRKNTFVSLSLSLMIPEP
jgi:hypothetical protein